MLTKAEEIERVQALRALDIVDSPATGRFDRIVRVAQRIFGVPMVSVNLVGEDRLVVKAAVGMDSSPRPRENSLCALTVQQGQPLIIRDGQADPRYHDHPAIAAGPRLRFYAGYPLKAAGGYAIGTLCLYDTKPHDMDLRELELLGDLADWVERELTAADELDRAGEVQRALLPRAAPDIPGYEIAGLCIPAQQVGGDFYDWFLIDGQLQITVADVMGKGIPAAIIAAGMRAVLRGASKYNDLPDAVNKVATSVEPELLETSTFVTLFAARLDHLSHRLRYLDAGHGLAGIFDRDGFGRRLESDGLPLGAFPGQSWSMYEETFAPGETFISSSDGLLELFESVGRGLATMRDLIAETHTAAEVTERIAQVSKGQPPVDDITLVVIRRKGRP